jgi:type IV secretory pathway VirD2 relaxase
MPKPSAFERRAIVNVRYASSRTPGGWKAHGFYIERESAKNDRESQGEEKLGVAKERSLGAVAGDWQKAGDKRFFKIVISPEDQKADFGQTAQDLIARIESDVDGKVEWGGVIHRNTDHPHAHIVVRGRLRSGEELILPRELIRRGLREAVQRSLTRQLGPRTFEEIEHQKQAELTANRATPLDRRLVYAPEQK